MMRRRGVSLNPSTASSSVVEKAAEAPGAKALALEADEALVPASTLKIGEAVMVEETNRTGTVARCAANEWCTVTMDDDGTVETYRAPQLLRKEKVPVPFDPASSGELMLQRDEEITSETRRRKRRAMVGRNANVWRKRRKTTRVGRVTGINP